MEKQILRAEYKAPNGQTELLYTISGPESINVPSKQTYLSELRKSARTLQEELNTFLTAKMEEDKHLAVTSGSKAHNATAIDEEEEANYGEEKLDED